MVEDIHNLKRILERDAEKYLSRLKIEDREEVRRFMNDLQAQGITAGRVVKYLCTLTNINERLARPFKTAGSDDFKRYVAWVENADYSDWTKHDMKIMLKKYLHYLGKQDTIAWMKIKSVKNSKLPEDVLTEKDIKAMADAAYTSRDTAFIESFYESGARVGEFLPLKLKHLTFDKYGAVLWVTGKTGDRRIRLVASALAIQGWLNEHPAKNNPEAYLWCKTPAPNNPKWKNNHLSYGFIARLLSELAAKADIKKSVNPHAFRHSRATFMASRLKEPEMREFFGWSKESDMVSTYVHLSGRDIDNSVLSIYGYQDATKTQEPVLKAKSCPRCQEQADPASRFCKKCGLPLDEKMNVDKLEGIVVDFLKIMSEAFPEMKEKFRDIVRQRGAESLFA